MSWAARAGTGTGSTTASSPSHSIPFQVPKSFHYSLIGSRGVVVKRLERNSGARFHIPSRGDPSATVRVSGTDAVLAKAQTEMEKILGFKISTDPLVVCKYNIPANFYGKMIGPRAATVQGLEKKHGCSIVIPRKGSKETIVSVQGNKDNVEAIHEAYQQLLGIQFEDSSHAGDDEAKAGELSFTVDIHNEEIADVLFFPDKDGTDGWDLDHFLEFLRCGHETLDICVFTITYDQIAEAILKQWDSGVKIRIITDNDQASALGSDILKFKEAGIPIKQDKTEAHMHHKFCVIDNTLVMNGSFNWTKSASFNNQENCMVTNNKVFAQKFSDHFEEMWNDDENFIDY